MKKILFFSVLAIFCFSAIITALAKNPPSPAPTVPCPNFIDGKLTLLWNCNNYPNRVQGGTCGPCPNAASTPTAHPGTTNMAQNPSRWYLKVTVTGDDIPSRCTMKSWTYNPSTTLASTDITIKIPEDHFFDVSVEFYEDKNYCTADGSGRSGRPKFTWKAPGSGYSGFTAIADLQYVGTIF